VSGGGRARGVGPGDFEVFAKFLRSLEFHELPRLGEVDACVVSEVTWEDEEESLSDDGVTEDGGIFASLDVLELGCESFKAVEELGRFLIILGSAGHPRDLGVLEDGLGFEFPI